MTDREPGHSRPAPAQPHARPWGLPGAAALPRLLHPCRRVPSPRSRLTFSRFWAVLVSAAPRRPRGCRCHGGGVWGGVGARRVQPYLRAAGSGAAGRAPGGGCPSGFWSPPRGSAVAPDGCGNTPNLLLLLLLLFLLSAPLPPSVTGRGSGRVPRAAAAHARGRGSAAPSDPLRLGVLGVLVTPALGASSTLVTPVLGALVIHTGSKGGLHTGSICCTSYQRTGSTGDPRTGSIGCASYAHTGSTSDATLGALGSPVSPTLGALGAPVTRMLAALVTNAVPNPGPGRGRRRGAAAGPSLPLPRADTGRAGLARGKRAVRGRFCFVSGF